MARPTTRYGRYKAMQQKHARRRYRWRQRGRAWAYDAVTDKWSRGGIRYAVAYGGKLSAWGVPRFHGQATVSEPFPGSPIIGQVTYNDAGWGMPHCGFYFTGGAKVNFDPHMRRAVLWFHVKRQRRVINAGRTMSKLQRRVWAANLFYMREGLHSATDPLGRSPNEIDWDGVSPLFAEGPVPAVHWSSVP